MSNVKGTTAALIVLLVVTMASSLAALQAGSHGAKNTNRAISPSRDGERAEVRQRFPVVDYEAQAESEGQQPEERKIKNKRYDKSGLVRKNSSTEIEETVREIYRQGAVEAIPVGQSSAIVVGEVQASRAYLSNDKSGVYTEMIVRIDEVLKNDGSASLAVGGTVSADRPGGTVKYRNGHKRLYRILGLNMPHTGGRYVLFLSREAQEPNYRIITGYELGPDGAVPLDVAPEFDAYKGVDSTAFLQTVRDAIARS